MTSRDDGGAAFHIAAFSITEAELLSILERRQRRAYLDGMRQAYSNAVSTHPGGTSEQYLIAEFTRVDDEIAELAKGKK